MRQMIVGTDWWTDCDDVIALRLLARSAAAGEIGLLGVILNGCMPDSVASLDTILAQEGLCVPIGLDREATDFGGNPPYQKNLAASGPHRITNDDAQDGVRLYRQLLTQAAPGVEIIELGYPQVLAALLESPPDDLSPLDGCALVREKVSRFWVMAGKWDEDPGRENNFARNARSRRGGSVFCRLCPVPVTFLGYEVGFSVITGSHLSHSDPVYGALRDHGSAQGRSSWDPMLALLAVIGDPAAAGYRTVRGRASVDAETGLCTFTQDPAGLHCYVVKLYSDDRYAAAIDRRIASCPNTHTNKEAPMTLQSFGLPEFHTVAGMPFPAATMDHDDVQFCVVNVVEEECRAYARTLIDAGFTLHAFNEIPAGSQSPYFCNLYYTLLRQDHHVFLSWQAALHTIRIIIMDPAPVPSVQKPAFTPCNRPTFSLLQLKGGLSMASQLADGSFVLFDGGNYTPEDARLLYDFLRERTPADRLPCIALWLFTHLHVDHVELATRFLEEYAGRVEVRAFAHQLQNARTIELLESLEKAVSLRTALDRSIARYPDAQIYPLHAGQLYHFPGMSMEILWTGDDMFPGHFFSFNELSIACRLRFDSGRTVMVLGDCMQNVCRNLALCYGDYLKSDVLQLAHHGLIGGDKALYRLIDPEDCFWATNERRFAGTLEGQVYQWCLGEGGLDYNAWIRDDRVRKRRHYHNSVTTTLFMD